jgi:8-oxo-dGTP diphosphatase
MMMPAIDVAVAVVRNSAGHVLLAERTARQVAAGFWELPGGKIENGETPEQGAARELVEETGITAHSLLPLMVYDHAFPTKRVRLHIFQATVWAGTPSGREGQRLAWTDPARPSVAPILSSNVRVLAALGLPGVMEIVQLAGPAPALLAQVRAALASGVRLMQLHGERLAPDQRVSVARRICSMASAAGCRVLLAGSALEAERAGAAGMHSSATSLRCMVARPPVLLWSVLCGDTNDINRAAALGADFAVMRPAGDCGARTGSAHRLEAPGLLPVYVAGTPLATEKKIVATLPAAGSGVTQKRAARDATGLSWGRRPQSPF